MPARDLYHDCVRIALERDGWTVTDDPFVIKVEGVRGFIDLAAEKLLAAEKSDSKIAVEIKVFGGPSPMADLEDALGQYGLYRTMLKAAPQRYPHQLYLAVAVDVYRDFFRQKFVELVVADHGIKLLVFDQETEEIVQWIQ